MICQCLSLTHQVSASMSTTTAQPVYSVVLLPLPISHIHTPFLQLDNPSYYDPDILKCFSEIEDKYKKKRGPAPLVADAHPAILTKLPALRRWKLDFTTPPRAASTRNWGRILVMSTLVILMALLLAGVGIIAHMAVHTNWAFGRHWLYVDEGGSPIVEAQFRIINRNYISHLQNSTSTDYLRLVGELKHSLNIIFMDSTLVNYYNSSNNFRFGNGSVIVQCEILLNKPIANAPDHVGLVFVEALEKGRGILPPGILYVDVHTVKFYIPKIQPESSYLQTHVEKKASWSQWSEWSSCLTKEGVCDGSKVRLRRRECRFDTGDKSETHLCLLETGEDVVVQAKNCNCPLTPTSVQHETAAWSQWGEWTSCSDLSNRCDPRQTQRRSRTCERLYNFDHQEAPLELLPNAVCTRQNSDTGIQMRQCLCPGESAAHPYNQAPFYFESNLKHPSFNQTLNNTSSFQLEDSHGSNSALSDSDTDTESYADH